MSEPPQTIPSDIGEPLTRFIDKAEWTFAKTMPQWPHWYVLKESVPEREAEFMDLVRLILEEGVDEQWRPSQNYERTVRYLRVGGLKYWVMDPRPEAVTLINRARLDGTSPADDDARGKTSRK